MTTLYAVSAAFASVAFNDGILTQEPQYYQELTNEMLEGFVRGYINIAPPPNLDQNYTNNNPPTFKFPQLTTLQRDSLILTPADEGLIIYNTDQNVSNLYDGAQWQIVGSVPTTPYAWNAPSASQIVYVQKDGNDTTGDGSIYRPYATVTHALNQILDAAFTKAYCINIGPGSFTETTVFKPFVYLNGAGRDLTTLTTTTRFEIPFTFTFNSICQVENLKFVDQVSLNPYDANITNGFRFTFRNVSFLGDMFSRSNHFNTNIQFYDCLFAQVCSSASINSQFYNCNFLSATEANTLGARLTNVLYHGCFFGLFFNMANSSTYPVTVVMSKCTFDPAAYIVTYLNGLVPCEFYSDSLPPQSRIAINGSAAPNWVTLDDAFISGYEPANVNDWGGSAPLSVGNALDRLAIAVLNGGGGGGGGPVSSNDVTYNPDVPENWGNHNPSVLTPYMDELGQKFGGLYQLVLNRVVQGTTTLFCIDTGNFASLQQAIDYLPSGERGTILVGAKSGGWGDIVIRPGISIAGLSSPQSKNVEIGKIYWPITPANSFETFEMNNIYCKGGILILGTQTYNIRLSGCVVDAINSDPIYLNANPSDSTFIIESSILSKTGNGPAIVHQGGLAQFVRCTTYSTDTAINVNTSTGLLVYSLGNISVNGPVDTVVVNNGGFFGTLFAIENYDPDGNGIYVASSGNCILSGYVTSYLNQVNGYIVRGDGTLTYNNIVINGTCDRIQDTLTINHNTTQPVIVP